MQGALVRITATELKLLLRDLTALTVVLGLPLAFLLIFGSMGAPTPAPGSDPRGAYPFVAAMSVTLSIGMLGLFTLPTYLGTYRERGVLRRLAVTPVSPIALLLAQLAVHAAMAFVGIALVLVAGPLVIGMDGPGNPVGFVAAAIAAVVALLAVGLVVAAVAPNGRAAGGLGSLLFFPLLFFAGAWMPKSQMPSWLATIGDLTPVSAASEALAAAWAGGPLPIEPIVILIATSAIAGAVAARVFRWS